MIRQYSSPEHFEKMKLNYDKEMLSERRVKLKRRFGKLNPEEFVEYHLAHPECPKAHEYITCFASPKFLEKVLELIEERRN